MQQEAVGSRNCTRGSPLPADFTGARVQPAATLGSVVNVNHVIFVLLRSQGFHEAIVISADRDRASIVARCKFHTLGRVINLCCPATACVVLFKDALIQSIEYVRLLEAELGFAAPTGFWVPRLTCFHGCGVEVVEQ